MGEILIEACRRDNIDLMKETLEGKSEEETAELLNKTTTVMGNHLYHEAAARGNCMSCFPPSSSLPPSPSFEPVFLSSHLETTPSPHL